MNESILDSPKQILVNYKNLPGILVIGFLTWLNSSGCVYLINSISSYALKITFQNGYLIFYSIEILDLILLSIATFFILKINYSFFQRTGSIKKVILTQIALLFLIQAGQYFGSFYGSEFFLTNYFDPLKRYGEFYRNDLNLEVVNSIFYYISYLVFGLVVYNYKYPEDVLN